MTRLAVVVLVLIAAGAVAYVVEVPALGAVGALLAGAIGLRRRRATPGLPDQAEQLAREEGRRREREAVDAADRQYNRVVREAAEKLDERRAMDPVERANARGRR